MAKMIVTIIVIDIEITINEHDYGRQEKCCLKTFHLNGEICTDVMQCEGYVRISDVR